MSEPERKSRTHTIPTAPIFVAQPLSSAPSLNSSSKNEIQEIDRNSSFTLRNQVQIKIQGRKSCDTRLSG